jgi:hypothetical protein
MDLCGPLLRNRRLSLKQLFMEIGIPVSTHFRIVRDFDHQNSPAQRTLPETHLTKDSSAGLRSLSGDSPDLNNTVIVNRIATFLTASQLWQTLVICLRFILESKAVRFFIPANTAAIGSSGKYETG